MQRYILRRLIQAVFTILAISVITFAVAKATPGSPFGMTDPELSARMSEPMKNHLKELYGLDKPIVVQYFSWLWAALHGDFGVSFQYRNETIQSIIGRTWPVSAQLGLISAAIALVFGTVIGIIAAVKKDSWFDVGTMGFTVFSFTMPSFVLGVFLLVIFCVNLKWFPITGWGTPDRMVLPVFALCLGPLAGTIRFTRASVLEVLNLDFVRTAYSKGLLPSLVMSRHVLKNALIPLVTVAGPMVAGLISGSFFVESMFNVPGIGKAFVGAAGARDYPMIMANAILFGSLIIVMNLLVDLTYGWIDPRIRFD
jgi:oligopeptide transport system permease protein